MPRAAIVKQRHGGRPVLHSHRSGQGSGRLACGEPEEKQPLAWGQATVPEMISIPDHDQEC